MVVTTRDRLDAFDNSGTFAIQAVDQLRPVALTTNSTTNLSGIPITLGFARAVTAGASIGELATFDDFNINQFKLSNGELLTVSQDSVSGAASTLSPGSTVNFTLTTGSGLGLNGGSPGFCGAPQAQGPPLLAVNAETNVFSLCHATGHSSANDRVVVFKAAPSQSGYDFSTCVNVVLELVGDTPKPLNQ
ncbi:hypothetical protein K474DRAFT_1777199 [Panus rudis PR-1116 ss-1]|nr:hypothetical protein K474DRAFT_1777199 [Panus rudis PR-1116 ss-1]